MVLNVSFFLHFLSPAVNFLTFRWQCCTTAPVATAMSPSRTLLMTLAPWWTPLSFYGDVKLLWNHGGLAQTGGTNRDRKSHLDVGQNVSARPIPAQTLHMLLSRESKVVIATTRDVCCGGDRGTEHQSADLPAPLMTSLLLLSQSGSSRGDQVCTGAVFVSMKERLFGPPTHSEGGSSQDPPQLLPASPHCRPLMSNRRTAASSFLIHKLVLSHV